MLKVNSTSAYLITKPEHIYYLTNFDGEGFVIVRKNLTLLATDQRYWLLAKEVKKRNVKLFDLKTGWPEKLASEMKGIKTIHFEEDDLTVAGLSRWKKMLPKRKWKQMKMMLKKNRLTKREDELKRLRQAARMGDKVLKMVLHELKPGVTEKHIANLLRQYSNESADGVSFDPIVAFGKNGAVPHHHPGQTELKKNDAILIDQGTKVDHYMSDMTRCFFIGDGIPEVKQMYDQLLAVQKAGVNMVRAGVKISELCQAVRALLGKDDKYFTHSLGHGIGLKVHEGPTVSSRADDVLEVGMVITIEPGIYKAGVGGVRIEDTVIVTEDGCEVITKSSKDPSL